MKKTIGILLTAVGIVVMAYAGFNCVTEEETVDFETIGINMETNHAAKWLPFIGTVLIVGGVVITTYEKGNTLDSKNKYLQMCE